MQQSVQNNFRHPKNSLAFEKNKMNLQQKYLVDQKSLIQSQLIFKNSLNLGKQANPDLKLIK